MFENFKMIVPRTRAVALLCLAIPLLSFSIACSKSESAAQGAPVPQAKATAIDPATAATISGMVNFSGTAPRAVKIDMSNDPACKGENQSEQVAVDDGHLANVLVYVKTGLDGDTFVPPRQVMTVKQEGCRYVPHVAAVMVGQPVNFVDSDHTEHNIHLSSKNNSEFNQSQSHSSQPIDKSFHNPEIMMPIKCNQHPWMKMYLSVLPNPYFTVTGKDGKFNLSGLPPGKYTIAAVHEKYGEQEQTVTVGPKQDETGVDFDYKGQ